jgi:hypothetical protein
MRTCTGRERCGGTLPSATVTCGPEFAGSRDIGGADADFILDGLPLDCKATIMPRRLGADEISQLAGYLLLGYPSQYGIRKVGLYLARQGAIIGRTSARRKRSRCHLFMHDA